MALLHFENDDAHCADPWEVRRHGSSTCFGLINRQPFASRNKVNKRRRLTSGCKEGARCRVVDDDKAQVLVNGGGLSFGGSLREMLLRITGVIEIV